MAQRRREIAEPHPFVLRARSAESRTVLFDNGERPLFDPAEFHIGERKGLPAGKWTVEIWNNNHSFASQTFTLVSDR